MNKTKNKKSTVSLINSRKFDWVDPSITDESFPPEEARSDDYRTFHFDGLISSEAAVNDMKREGYSPANITELLLWEGWDGKDSIAALGSVGWVDGNRNVPCLRRVGSKRRLFGFWFGRRWPPDYRFLAVRNPPLKPLEPDNKKLAPLDTLNLESAIKTVKDAGYVIHKVI